tara:strand:+ start:97 stop:495 length:399 start_codon:yes stop_codon:yes gene_type:complete
MSIVIINGSRGLVGSESAKFFSKKFSKVIDIDIDIDNDMRSYFFAKLASVEKNFEVLNIGSGVSYSVAEVIKIIQQVKGTNFQVESSETIQDEEILHTCADITKAKNYLIGSPFCFLKKVYRIVMENSYGKK